MPEKEKQGFLVVLYDVVFFQRSKVRSHQAIAKVNENRYCKINIDISTGANLSY